MRRPPGPLPPSLASRPFTVAEARALGVSEDRLRASDLRRPFHGVRVSGSMPWTVALRARAAALVLPPGAVLCGDDAVALWCLPLPFGAADPLGSPVGIAVPPRVVRPRTPHLLVRRAALHPASAVAPLHAGGAPLLGREDLWAERCGELDLDSAVALGDAVRRRAARDAMDAAAGRLPDATARGRAREVLALVRFEVCSPLETRLRLLLRAAGVPAPSHCSAGLPRQGGPVVWPDLQWEHVRLAVEVDGSHHRAQRQWQNDLVRRRLTEDLGWRLLVVSGHDVLVQPRRTVAHIARELRARGLVW